MSFDENTFDPKNNQKEALVFDTSKPWVILKMNGQSNWITCGPFSVTEVKTKLKSGEIKATDYCWMSGWADWKRIYLEPEFYLSRKPPIEISKKKSASDVYLSSAVGANINFLDQENPDTDNLKNIASHESAKKITPSQYKASKYKKTSKEAKLIEKINIDMNVKNSKDGVLNMLEPWDSKIKDLDFIDETKVIKTKDTGMNWAPEIASPENYPKGDFDFEPENVKPVKLKISTRSIGRSIKWLLWVSVLIIFIWVVFRIYSILDNNSKLNFNMSYFVIEDYSSELPQYLYARTDLKKNEQIKIRVFDLSNKQVRTKSLKAGLMLTSKGTGRMRIPMYVYSLAPGAYNLVIEIEGQKIEKEFYISETKNFNL